MRIKLIIYFIIIYIALILQSTFAGAIEIWGVKPNLIIILIVCISMVRGGIEASLFGLIIGLFQDILSGKVIGPYALLGFLAGTLLGGFNKKFYRDNVFMCVAFTFLISLIYESLLFLPSFFTLGLLDYLLILKDGIAREAIYNALICIPIFIIILKIGHILERIEKDTRKF